jgi:hypothetical protein
MIGYKKKLKERLWKKRRKNKRRMWKNQRTARKEEMKQKTKEAEPR